MCNLKFISFKMFTSKFDIRLEISVVSTCVNLNKMSVHVNNWKLENLPVHWFGLTELYKTMGILCGRNSSKM